MALAMPRAAIAAARLERAVARCTHFFSISCLLLCRLPAM
jgi:hypothetical protein